MNRKLSLLQVAQQRVKEEKQALLLLEERQRVLEEAQELAQAVAQRIQSQAHEQIANVVTRCLAVFEEPYEFRIEFDRKRGRTEARLLFVREGEEVDPLSASGGGVVDVASFALRVAALALARPQRRKLLVLDEPFKHLSLNYRRKVRLLLDGLAQDLGIQFLLVTHDPALSGGEITELGS